MVALFFIDNDTKSRAIMYGRRLSAIGINTQSEKRIWQWNVTVKWFPHCFILSKAVELLAKGVLSLTLRASEMLLS